jgi:hypothetical protein
VLDSDIPVFYLKINEEVVLSDEANPADTCRYIATCEENQLSVYLEADANVVIKINNKKESAGSIVLPLTRYGDNFFHIEASLENNTPIEYILAIAKPIDAGKLIYQRWNDVLSVKNEEGMDSLANYIWYKDGIEMTNTRGKGYINIDETATYYVETNGKYQGNDVTYLTTCPRLFNPSNSVAIIYPTQINAGQQITILTFLNDIIMKSAQYQLISTSGRIISQNKLNNQETLLTIPAPGEYILRILANGGISEEFKIWAN